MCIMTNDLRASLTKKLFSDPKNYPYGFSRSGDFSINESKVLSQFGALHAALVDGLIEAKSEEENHFLAVVFEQAQPETIIEKAWLKYQKRINRPKQGNIYGNKPAQVSEEDLDVGDDLELEVNIEDDSP